MLRSITRFICLMISFQLAVGCNSAQLSVTGDSDFKIFGTIVKTFQGINNLVLPSAMAEVITGRVVAYNSTDTGNIFEIASQNLYDGKKTFNLSVPKKDVEGQVIYVRYEKSSSDDMREKIEIADDYMVLGEMELRLDADGSVETGLIREEIKSKTDPEDVKDTIKNFNSAGFMEVLKVVKSSSTDFSNFVDATVRDKAISLLYQLKNKEIDSDTFSTVFEVLKAETKTAPIAGGRLICSAADKVTVELASSKFSGVLSFFTSDKSTLEVLGAYGIKTDLGGFESAAAGIVAINAFYYYVQTAVNEKGLKVSGSFKLYDKATDVTTTCQFSAAPKDPEATTIVFDKFDLTKYGKDAEAYADLDKMFDETAALLNADFAAAKIDTKVSPGKSIYLLEVQKVVDMYTTKNDLTLKYFSK